MEYDLAPGDVLHIGEAVTLTVLAVEGELVRLELAPSEDERPYAGPDSPRYRGWELN
jgi:hypothetical protein